MPNHYHLLVRLPFAMLRDDDDDQWMQSQTGLAIGPEAFARRFTESTGRLCPRRGRPPKCARVSV